MFIGKQTEQTDEKKKKKKTHIQSRFPPFSSPVYDARFFLFGLSRILAELPISTYGNILTRTKNEDFDIIQMGEVYCKITIKA